MGATLGGGQLGTWPSARRRCRKKPGSVKTYSTRTTFRTINGAEAASSEATDTYVGGPAWRRTTLACGTPLAAAVRT